jgi:hypothetical protein
LDDIGLMAHPQIVETLRWLYGVKRLWLPNSKFANGDKWPLMFGSEERRLFDFVGKYRTGF